ncbi:MAG TPA: hypothetical protein PK069_07470 [Methanolinea sp.]|nr:hypothetical protein [Methanolinea sp.]HQK56167.1 hypothetical protein [Methanolinea sp.]
MVGDDAQIFTIEGISAAFLILFTTYLAVSTTTVLTPGDTHIADLQLTQLGNDALAIMDTPDTAGGSSELQEYIMNNDKVNFHNKLAFYLNTLPGTAQKDRIKFSAKYYYRAADSLSKVVEYPFDDIDTYYRENAVTVTRWVYLPDTPVSNPPDMRDTDHPKKVVLLEVLLWR